MKPVTKQEYRHRRHVRLRRKIRGTAERPRMSVFVSNRHLYVQFIDDDASRTLATVSTRSEAMKGVGRLSIELAKKLGACAAQAARERGVETVVFDRGGFTYGGRIRALAESAREAGLKF
jgi:large subunit ribosomal protein L18